MSRKIKKPNRLYPRHEAEKFKFEVEDSVMAAQSAEEPIQEFAPTMVNAKDRKKFDAAVVRLCGLGCRQDMLYYCLGRAKFGPRHSDKFPSPQVVRKLAKGMKRLAPGIAQMERTGLMDPLDEAGPSRSIAEWAERLERFRTLPATLTERAAMYVRWAERLSGRGRGDFRLRRDLLSRINRVSLSVYVKLATNSSDVKEPLARFELVATLLGAAGMSGDKSQLKRELEEFEDVHFQAEQALRDKLKRLHDAEQQRGEQ
jgi:hypothetical protein